MPYIPTDPAFYQNPYPAYADMQSQGPAFYWDAYKHWCFPHYADVSALFRDKRLGRQVEHIASRAAFGLEEPAIHLAPFYAFEAHSLLEKEPPAHTRLRKLVNRAFVSRHVERLRPEIERLAHELIDGFEAKGSTDLLPVYAEKIPVIVIADLLGVPSEMAPQLLSWSHDMVAMYQFNRSRLTEDKAVAATIAFSDFMRNYIDQRRATPKDDLISLLIAAEEAGDSLSTDELISTCILLLNAGHEATVHALGNSVKTILELGLDPTILFATPTQTARVVDELLRYDPPLHMFTRYVLEDLTYQGINFKAGDVVGLMLAAANHDPQQFPHPERFDPNRTNAHGHTSLGAGIHFCVGAPLARLEMQVALPVLFKRLPNLGFASPPYYADRYHFHGLERLQLQW